MQTYLGEALATRASRSPAGASWLAAPRLRNSTSRRSGGPAAPSPGLGSGSYNRGPYQALMAVKIYSSLDPNLELWVLRDGWGLQTDRLGTSMSGLRLEASRL